MQDTHQPDEREMIAFCGLSCHECPTFLATQANDDAKRIKIAKRWSEKYEKHNNLRPEEINCDGCLTENGALFKTCRVCPIRECGLTRKVTNCAYCEDYPCQQLDEIFDLAPDSKKKLDEIRKSI